MIVLGEKKKYYGNFEIKYKLWFSAHFPNGNTVLFCKKN